MHIEIRPLEGRYVRLEPLVYEHKAGLRRCLDCDEDTWEIMAVNGCGDGFDSLWARLIGEKRRGRVVGPCSRAGRRERSRGQDRAYTVRHVASLSLRPAALPRDPRASVALHATEQVK